MRMGVRMRDDDDDARVRCGHHARAWLPPRGTRQEKGRGGDEKSDEWTENFEPQERERAQEGSRRRRRQQQRWREESGV